MVLDKSDAGAVSKGSMIWSLKPRELSQDLHDCDQLDGIAECYVHQCPHGVTQTACHALGGMAEKSGQRNYRNGIHGKYHPGR